MTDTRPKCATCCGRGVDEWNDTCIICGGQGREPFREWGKEEDEDQSTPRTTATSDYFAAVLNDNICRCEDIIWDIENKDVFDKTDGQILGVLEVAKTIRASLTGLKSQLYPVLYPNKATTENIGDK